MWRNTSASTSQVERDVPGGGLDVEAKQVTAAATRLADVQCHYHAVAVAVRTTDELRRLRGEMNEEVCDTLENLGVELAKEHEMHAASS